MARKTYYEWDVETIDENGDVLDHHHEDRLADLLRGNKILDSNEALVLVFNLWDEADGVIDRAWAYVDSNGQLPDYFRDASGNAGKRVPKRFHAELARHSG